MYNQYLNLHEAIKGAPSAIPGMRPAHIYPSSTSVKVAIPGKGVRVYGGCNRKQYLQYIGEAPSDFRVDGESLGVFTAGDQIQDIIENRFKMAGIFVQSELPIYIKEYNVSGRVDTIIHNKKEGNEGQFLGVEIKSKAGYYASTKFINPLKTGDPKETFRPSDEHILQSMVYMHAFNTQAHLKKYAITRWLLLYILRDNYDYNHFEIELTKDDYTNKAGDKTGPGYPILYSKAYPDGFVYTRFKMADILVRWKELLNSIDKGNIPDRDFLNIYTPTELQIRSANGEFAAGDKKKIADGKYGQVSQMNGGVKEPKGDFACMYCQYRSKCWGLGNYSENSFDNDYKRNRPCV